MKTWFITLGVSGGGTEFRSVKRASLGDAQAAAEDMVKGREGVWVVGVEGLRERLKTVGKGGGGSDNG